MGTGGRIKDRYPFDRKKLLCLTQTSQKENKDILKELEPAKDGLAKVGPKGLSR